MKYFRLCCPKRRVDWDAKSSGQLHGVLAKSWHPGCGFLARGLEKQDGRPVPFQLWHAGVNEARKIPQSRTTIPFLIMQENKHHTTSRACGVCVYVEWGFQVDPCIFDNICLRGAKELWKMLYFKKKGSFLLLEKVTCDLLVTDFMASEDIPWRSQAFVGECVCACLPAITSTFVLL